MTDDMDDLREYYLGELDKKDTEIERLDKQNVAFSDTICERDDEIGRLCAEIERLRSAVEWQSIETAPRDGSRFLGCDGVFVGVCKRHDPGGRYECWVGEGDEPWSAKPISWMPLPEPPDYNLEPKP